MNAVGLHNEIVNTYERLIHFPEAWTYQMTSLFVLQTYVSAALNGVWYLAFLGPKGSGKTTALEVTAELCKDSVVSNNMSPAVMARIAKDHTLFIDELDELKGEAMQTAEGVLRAGYRSGIKYMRCEGKNNEVKEYDVFGPKCFTLRTEPEDALMSRTYGARTAPPQDPADVRKMYVANSVRDLNPLREKLAAWATPEVLKEFQDGVGALLTSKGFADRLDAMLVGGAKPRDIELAAACLSMAHVLGIDVQADVMAAMSVQVDYEDDSLSDFKEELYGLWRGMGEPPIVSRRELKEAFNVARVSRRETPIGQKTFSKLLTESGARRNIEIKKPGRGKSFAVHFTRDFITEISSDSNSELIINPNNTTMHPNKGGEDNQPYTQTPAYGSRSALNSGAIMVQVQARPTTQLERFSAVRTIAGTLSAEGGFTLKDLVDRALLLQIQEAETRAIFNSLHAQGRIVEPKKDGRCLLVDS